MTRARFIVGGVACTTLLWTGAAFARFTPSAQQLCDNARITAWKVYQSCVDGVVAKDAKGVTFDEFKAFWGCRHTYFKKWAAFQTKAALATSSCAAGVNNRFTVTDSGATVTDGLTGLVWELKTNSGVNNGSDTYSWCSGPHTFPNFSCTNPSSPPDGTAFTTFLTTDINAPGFAGANGWQLPTLAELQTILADFPCTHAGASPTCVCTSSPCIAFSDPNTQANDYWSATTYLPNLVPNPALAWSVSFSNGAVGQDLETFSTYVRAVRGGL